MNRRMDGMMVAVGAIISCTGLIVLAVSGLFWLNSIGAGYWLGWGNLFVFCGGWWLAWLWTRPGTTIPAPDWAVPPHFLPRDREAWQRLQELAHQPPVALLEGTFADAPMVAAFHEAWGRIEAPYRIGNHPAWSAHTAAEWTTALRAILERLARRSHILLGPLLSLRIDRWLLAWRTGMLAGRYGAIAWLPGLILAPLDTVIRFVAGLLLRKPAEQGVRREAVSALWMLVIRDAGVVVIDLLAGRLAGKSEHYTSLIEPMAPIGGRVRVWRPILLGATQAVPLGIVVVAGMAALVPHGIWCPIVPVVMLLAGLGIFVSGARQWLFPPLPQINGRVEAESHIEETLGNNSAFLAGITSVNGLLRFVSDMDRAVSKAMTGNATGWKSRSSQELIGACRDMTDRMEDLIRRALPGSRHLSLAHWIAAGGWLGWLSKLAGGGMPYAGAMRGTGGVAGLFAAWAGGVIRRQADSTLREALSRATVRILADVLMDLHAGRWQGEFAVGPKHVVVQPVLMIVGQSGSGVSTVVEELKQYPELQGWEIQESSSLWAVSHAESSADAVSSLIARADVVILVTRAMTAARDADVQLLDGLDALLGERRIRPPVLGLLTGIDLVPPALEWNPPYPTVGGVSRKELGIQACVDSARQALGDRVDEWIPTGIRNGVTWGFSDGIVPWLGACIDRAHGVRVARELLLESEKNGWMEVPLQAKHGARTAWSFFLRGWKKPAQTS